MNPQCDYQPRSLEGGIIYTQAMIDLAEREVRHAEAEMRIMVRWRFYRRWLTLEKRRASLHIAVEHLRDAKRAQRCIWRRLQQRRRMERDAAHHNP